MFIVIREWTLGRRLVPKRYRNSVFAGEEKDGHLYKILQFYLRITCKEIENSVSCGNALALDYAF